MATSIVRRLYIYAAAFIGLQMLAAGLRQLLHALLETTLVPDAVSSPDFRTEQISISIALLVVGLVLWAVHWRWVQRSLVQPDERHSALRRLYGYLVLLVAIISLLFNCYDLVARLLQGAASIQRPEIGRASADIAVNGLIWLAHWRIFSSDRVLVEQTGATATLRRWYLVLIQAVSLSMASFAAVSVVAVLITSLLEPVISGTTRASFVLPGLIAGFVLWLPHELWARQLLRFPTPLQVDESRSTLRHVYAALVITVTVLALLSGLVVVVYSFMLIGLGGTTWSAERWNVVQAVAMITVAAPLWIYHRARLAEQAQITTVQARVDTARRTIDYLTAAVGLVTLFFGLGGLLSTLLRLAFTPDVLLGSLQESLSFNLALSSVALPVYGWTLLRRARLVSGSVEEQQTLARRMYLYGALLFGIVALIVAVVALVRLVLQTVLGAAEPNLLTEVGRWLGYGLIALAITWYHVTLLRRTGTVHADAGRGQTIVILAASPLRELLRAAITRELPGAEIADHAPDDLAALPELLSGVQVLVVPLALVLSGPVAPTIAAFPARKLVLASAGPGLELIGGGASDAVLARQAAQALRTAATTTPDAASAGPARLQHA